MIETTPAPSSTRTAVSRLSKVRRATTSFGAGGAIELGGRAAGVVELDAAVDVGGAVDLDEPRGRVEAAVDRHRATGGGPRGGDDVAEIVVLLGLQVRLVLAVGVSPRDLTLEGVLGDGDLEALGVALY